MEVNILPIISVKYELINIPNTTVTYKSIASVINL